MTESGGRSISSSHRIPLSLTANGLTITLALGLA
jgi:hypothetical protein